MNKPNKRETVNLVFSAILIVGYIVCSYFFLTLATGAPHLANYIKVLVFAVFGLVVFYATRIGEGVQIKRFSLATLLILDLPALYAIVAYFIPQMPLHDFIANLGGEMPLEYSPLLILACVALGYGIPYTFLSGYEQQIEEEFDEEALFAQLEEALEAFESEGEAVLYAQCEAEDEGAILVVDDLDAECNEETEIRQQFAITAQGVAEVGSYVKLVEAEECECGCCCGCECGCEEGDTKAETEAAEADKTADEE